MLRIFPFGMLSKEGLISGKIVIDGKVHYDATQKSQAGDEVGTAVASSADSNITISAQAADGLIDALTAARERGSASLTLHIGGSNAGGLGQCL